jgi:hypothetical protein
MRIIEWIAFVAGLALVLTTAKSVVNTIILPRSVSSKIAYRVWLVLHTCFMVGVRRMRRYESKDRLLAYASPITLIALLVIWLLLFLLGYALMFWPLVHNFGLALRLSGSSVFTLGVFSSGLPGPIVLEYLAAATGLIVVALQIGYLPTIYGAYNRREILVSALTARSGSPSWGPEILARHQLSLATETLPALYTAWENLAADIAETHTSYPWLIEMRSPNPLNSWIISLLAIMDSANLYITLSPRQAPASARQCLRMGFVGLRAIAKVAGVAVNDDPRPDDPLQLTFEQFAFGVEQLRRVGFPVERSAEEAWPDFRGWRVNYEAVAYGLADRILAVPAPWSGKRTHVTRAESFDVLKNRPRHRTPSDPEGLRVRRLEAGESVSGAAGSTENVVRVTPSHAE